MRDSPRGVCVCIPGADITYSYGVPGRPPELFLSEPVTTITHDPWQGVGRTIWEATTFTNGAYSYEIAISVDRMDENHPTQGSVTVKKNGETLTHLQCDPAGLIIGLWAVTDAKETLGVCWYPRLFRWGPCL